MDVNYFSIKLREKPWKIKNPNKVSLPYCSRNPHPFAWPLGLTLSWFTVPGPCLGRAPHHWLCQCGPRDRWWLSFRTSQPLLYKHPLLPEPSLSCHHVAPLPSCLPLALCTSTVKLTTLSCITCQHVKHSRKPTANQSCEILFPNDCIKEKKMQKLKQNKNKIKILFNIT